MKDIKPFLRHIFEECEFIQNTLQGSTFEDFVKNETLKRAVVRSLEIIGEASKNLPEDFRNKYKHIPWKQISGLRDLLIHKYFGVDYKNVWKIVKEDIPKLKEDVSKILEELK